MKNFSEPKRYIYIEDVKLAAALVTIGFQVVEDNPIERIVNNNQPIKCKFYFKDDGRIVDFIAAWQCKEDYFDANKHGHELNNPEHPFWYLRTGLRNRERLLDVAKNESRVIAFKTIKGKTYISTFNAYEFDRRKEA